MSPSRVRAASIVNLLVLLLLVLSIPVNSQEEVRVGYGLLSPGSGGRVPLGSALFALRNGDGVLVSEAGVGAVEPMSSGRIFVDEVGTRTALALANPSENQAVVDLVVRDTGGNPIAETALTLAGREHQAQFVDELFQTLPAGFTGTLDFTARQPGQALGAVTLRLSSNGHGEPLFATLPVAQPEPGLSPSGAPVDSVIFPHVGAGGGILSTQIILINRSNRAVRGQIEFRGGDGAPLAVELDGVAGSSFPFQLRPNGSNRSLLTSGPGVVQGYAIVTVDPGQTAPAGTAVFQFRDGAGSLVSEAGVGAVSATTRSRVFVDNAGTRTGVALAIAGDAPAEVDFELLGRQGFPIETARRSLPGRGQIALFADELFPDLPNGFSGLLEIRSDVPVIPITLKLTTNSRGDLILTTLPVADLANPGLPGQSIFAQVGFGAGFATRLVLINTDLDEDAPAALEFRRSDGSELRVPLGEDFGSTFEFTIAAGGARQLRPGNTSQPAAVLIDPGGQVEVVVNRGQVLSLNPVIIDDDGGFRDDFDVSFESLSQDVASVDERGRVNGHQTGFSTLTATSGGAVGAVTITVVEIASGTPGFEVAGLARDLAGRTYMAASQSHTILLAAATDQPPVLYAGQEGVPGYRDGPPLDSRFNGPSFLAFSQADGHLFVTDSENNVIRQISPGLASMVTSLAGGMQPGSRDGALNQARFRHPAGIAMDARGNLWVADSENHTIRRIDLIREVVETVAGQPGSAGFEDGLGTAARFHSPAGVAVEPEPLALQLERERRGDPPPPVSLIVADRGNGMLRRVSEVGEVTTLGSSVSSAGGYSPSQVQTPLLFDSPTAVAADSLGRIYVSEPGRDRVSVLLPSGDVVPAVQRGTLRDPVGIAVNQSGELVISDVDRSLVQVSFGAPQVLGAPANRDGRVVLNGRNFASDTTVVIPGATVADLVVEDTSTLSFTLASGSVQDSLLTVLNRAGVRQRPVRVFADGTIGNPISGFASFTPSAVALDVAGEILAVTAGDVSSVFRIRPSTGTASVAAGNFSGSGGDGGPAKAAGLNSPRGLDSDRQGNFYIADSGNHRIRRVNSSGIIDTVAGSGTRGFAGDNGAATEAELDSPQGVVIDRSGNLYLSDTLNNRVRRVDAVSGQITTVAGNGVDQFAGDGGPAVDASLSGPQGLALDAAGNLLITDTGNNRIRRVDAGTGIIMTVAGTGQFGFSGDGQAATAARLNFPADVAVDFDGNILIADSSNRRLRRVDAQTGIITTIAGNGGSTDNRQDGVPATSFPLFEVVGVALDGGGNIFMIERSSSSQSFDVLRVHALTGIVSTFRVEALLAD